MNDRITMAQVAERAGVHPTTVSLALRNHPSIPPATRDRIRDLATEMGYRPDPVLNALAVYRHRKTPRRDMPALAYLTHWDAEWGWRMSRTHTRYYVGAAAKAAEVGYKLEHFWIGEPGLSHQRINDILFARGITGIVVASQLPRHDQPLRFEWAKFCGVKIEYLPREPVLHRIAADHRAIAQLAVQRIIAAGYRRIGLVIPRGWDESVNWTWSAGFLAEQQRMEPRDRIPLLSFDEEALAEASAPEKMLVPKAALAEWLKRHRPQVVLSVAEFVQPRLGELGLAVPRDLAFVDLRLELDSGAAGVRHNCERIGSLAVETLVGQMQQNALGIPECATSTLVEGTWVDGPSLPVRAGAPAAPP